MVNWKDPAIIAEQYLGVAKVTHFCAGVFLWEFLSTMDYEFTVYTQKRPFRWTLLIYLLTRYATLGAMLCYIIGFNDRIEFDCKAWLKATYAFSYCSLSLASGLIALRAVALWNFHRIIVSVVSITWLGNVASMVYGIVQAHQETAWDLASRTCIAKNTAENAINCIATFVTDFVLLLSMISGILRTKNDQGSLWRLLYYQGVVWTALATIAEVPLLIFLNLNLNDPMNLMFQPVAMTILNIAATRLYRDLTLSASPNFMPFENLPPLRFTSSTSEISGTGQARSYILPASDLFSPTRKILPSLRQDNPETGVATT